MKTKRKYKNEIPKRKYESDYLARQTMQIVDRQTKMLF